MTFGEGVISAAVLAHSQEPKDPAAAAKLLVAHCKLMGLQAPANPAEFMQTWQDRMDSEGHIQYHSSSSGRPSKLSDTQVEKAYKAIMGWEKAGLLQPYESFEDAAENCDVVKQVLAESGAALGTLITRIKAKHPKFGRHPIKFQWKLAEHNLIERVTVCKELLEMDRSLLKYVVHLDAKTVYMNEKAAYGLLDLAVHISVSRIQPARRHGKVIRIKYYAAVSAVLGPIIMIFYTGTTDMPSTRDGLNYEVSHVTQTTLVSVH